MERMLPPRHTSPTPYRPPMGASLSPRIWAVLVDLEAHEAADDADRDLAGVEGAVLHGVHRVVRRAELGVLARIVRVVVRGDGLRQARGVDSGRPRQAPRACRL